MTDFEDFEMKQNVRQRLNDGLVALLQFVHGDSPKVYQALASQDLAEKARTLVDVASSAAPGETDGETRANVGYAVVIAGELLAEQKDQMAGKLA